MFIPIFDTEIADHITCFFVTFLNLTEGCFHAYFFLNILIILWRLISENMFILI
jgi:hypothetical protein